MHNLICEAHVAKSCTFEQTQISGFPSTYYQSNKPPKSIGHLQPMYTKASKNWSYVNQSKKVEDKALVYKIKRSLAKI